MKWQFFRKLVTSFESIDVLCVDPMKEILIVQIPNEVMDDVGQVSTGVELFSQVKEWLRIAIEIIELEYCLWIRNVVPTEIIVEPGARCPRNQHDRCVDPCGQRCSITGNRVCRWVWRCPLRQGRRCVCIYQPGSIRSTSQERRVWEQTVD